MNAVDAVGSEFAQLELVVGLDQLEVLLADHLRDRIEIGHQALVHVAEEGVALVEEIDVLVVSQSAYQPVQLLAGVDSVHVLIVEADLRIGDAQSVEELVALLFEGQVLLRHG